MKIEWDLKWYAECHLRWLLIPLLVILGTQQVAAAGYLLKQGKGYAVCEAFKKRLDKLGSLKEPLPPNRLKSLIYEVPGVKEADWQNLEIGTHEYLFEKLIRYDMLPSGVKSQLVMRATGRGEFEVSEEKAKIDEKRVNERLSSWREDAAAGKAKLEVLRANIELYDDTPETIMRIWRKYGDGKYEYTVTMYPVTEDFKEIDLVKIGRAYWWPSGELVVYGNRHYLVVEDFLINSDFGNGLVPFCTIAFDFEANQKETKK